MKKTGLLLLSLLATAALAQQASSADASGIVPTTTNVPVARFQTPTAADQYCAGFISEHRVPDSNYVNGGLQTPNTTKFTNGEVVYLAGSGYQQGQQYTIVRELRDINEYEFFAGQRRMVASKGQPYAEIGRVKVLDTRAVTRSTLAMSPSHLSKSPRLRSTLPSISIDLRHRMASLPAESCWRRTSMEHWARAQRFT